MRLRFSPLCSGLVAVLFLTLAPQWVFSAEPPEDDFAVADLLDILASSTSRGLDLTVREAPGVVRTFRQEDIKRLHMKSLKDVLKHVPGVVVNEYRAGHSLAWFRGVQSRYNNKVLFLVDGVPVRDSYYGHFDINEGFPLGQVERIEVINGPGGVLFGANAFAGVVSVTTKTEGRSVQVGGGSDSSFRASLEYSHASDEMGSVYGYGAYAESDGWDPEFNSDGSTFDHKQDLDSSYGLLKYQRGDTSERGEFSAIASYTDHRYQDRYRKEPRDREYKREPGYVTLKYAKDVKDLGTLKLSTYYEKYEFSKDETDFVDVESDTERLDTNLYGADVDFSMQLDNGKWGRQNIVVGAAYQKYESDDIESRDTFPAGPWEPGLHGGDADPDSAGFFIQDILKVSDKLSFTAGVRQDILSDFDNEFTYRVGMTGNHEGYYGKLLVGNSYRVPSFREYLDVVAYNDSLETEHLTTFELQVGRRFMNGDVNLTLFYNDYEDFIRELEVDSIGARVIDDEYAINADNREITGLEVFGLFYPINSLSLRFGGTYFITAKEKIGSIDSDIVLATPVNTSKADIEFLPDYTLSLLANYDLTSKWTLGTSFVVHGPREKPEGGVYQSDIPANVQDSDNLDAFVQVDVFTTYEVNDKLSVRARISNLFDEESYSPPFGNSAKYDAEWEGRKGFVELDYKF